jgi:hypothetical protein
LSRETNFSIFLDIRRSQFLPASRRLISSLNFLHNPMPKAQRAKVSSFANLFGLCQHFTSIQNETKEGSEYPN